MAGVGELLASAVLKQVGGKLATAMWKAIASQLKLGEELSGLQIMLANIQTGLRKAEGRSMKDGNICVWLRELKAAAYDMEDMLMDFEYQISGNRHNSESNSPAKEVSIPLKLRPTLHSMLKAMRTRLENIANLRRFDFMSDTSSDDQDGFQTQPTGPALGEDIFGRIKEKQEMMELLREDCEHSIIPIYGFGGLGKTTLAQMVYNDSTTKADFDIRIWVYVSTTFGVEKIGRSVISQVDGQSNQFDFPSVQKRVEMILSGKRSLIVLDDIWEENACKLEEVRTMLKFDKGGSKIIVTTRSEQVAKRMNIKLPFKLGVLPYEDCWNLFKAKAFPHGIAESQTSKEVMGEQIVKKCVGVPLAVKSLGYRLQNEPLPQWEETLQSDLWEEERDPTVATMSTAVLPSLKISYYYMPYYLRPCFVYFSAFPKGFTMEKSELMQRWIALGFVANTQHAEKCLQELLGMSFLEAVTMSPSISAKYSNPHSALFKMHDLVHELARSVAVEEVAISDASRQEIPVQKWKKKCRYILFSNFIGWAPESSDMPSKARAIHFKDCTGCRPSTNTFSETKWLRVLDFSGMQTVKLPKSMKKLHHLQVLNLSGNTCLEKLHGSICNLLKLHYLDLRGCSNFKELPEPVHKLKDLVHLDLSGCTRLQKLPSQFGKLQKLSFLNLSRCSQLEMLPDSFSQLRNLEHLNLSFCSQLKQLHNVSFKRMKGLVYVSMSSCTSLQVLPEFCGDNDGSLKLEILDLSYCDQLNTLPESCARLHKLRFLNLSGCSHIQNILFCLSKFAKLEYLNLSGVSMEKRLPGVGMKRDSETPGPSAGHCSNYSIDELSPRKLHEILKNMYHLEYFSVGGVSLFSEQGISRDLLTLPDFVVSTRGSGDCSNITLLQNILDSTHYELNIRCLEIVKSAEEVKEVELRKRHQLGSLSLEWSSSEWYTPSEPTMKTMYVLENLKPHQSLKNLTIKGYNHSMFPRWFADISYTLPNLVRLVLSDLICCDHLPNLGNLSKLEELEICNIPQLKEAFLAPCKNLKQLSLVDLASGCTLGICHDGWASIRAKRNCEEIHDVESDLAEELESHVVSKTWSGGPSQGNKETVVAMFGGVKSKGLTSDVPVSFPTLTASEETFPLLCYLKIQYCKHLILYPSILKCEEYFINESNLDFITETWSSTSILACKMHIKNCSYDNVRLLEFLDANIGELLIDGCSMVEEERGGEGEDVKIEDKQYNRLKKKLGNQIIEKIKIINYENYDLQNLPFIPSVRDLEIDCLRRIDSFSLLRHITCLEKLTLTSPENFLHTDKDEILRAFPHIQCIKINKAMYVSVQESDFLLFGQNRDFGLTELFITNLQKVKNTNDDSPQELARYNQVRRLSLVWPQNACSTRIRCLLKANGFPKDAQSFFRNGLLNSGKLIEEVRSILSQGSLDSDESLEEAHSIWRQALLGGGWSNDADSSFSQDLPRADDFATLRRLQPHPTNLSTLRIEGYQSATFCAWMSNPDHYLPNLVKIELLDMPRCNRLPSLGQLALLEEFHISDMPNIQEVDSSFYGGRHPFRKLKKIHINNMDSLEVWSTNLEPSAAQLSFDIEHLEEEIFPCLQNLIIKSCPRLKLGSAFQGCIRHIVDLCSKLAISSEKFAACSPAGCVLELESKIYGFSDTSKHLQYLIINDEPRLMLGSAFLDCIRRIAGSCGEVELSSGMFVGSSSGLSRLEVETNIFGLSEGSELLHYSVNLSSLTIKSVSDLTTLTDIIRNCHSLRSLKILECWNFAVIPDWLGDMASLEEIEIHAPKLQCLPHAIRGMTSLKKLVLKKCNYKLRERCSSSGEDYDKVKHIKHVDANEGPDFSASLSGDITLLQKTTSPQLIELNINSLEWLSTSEAKKIELAGKEELCSWSLEWSSYDRRSSSELDKITLEELQPHPNLKRLCIKNYTGFGFPNWVASLPNLVRLELSNIRAGRLHLDGLQNLEVLCISSFYWRDTHLLPMHMDSRYGTSTKHIVSMQALKNLKRVTIAGVGNLVWETPMSYCIEQNHDKNMEIYQRPMERTDNSIGSQSYCWPIENICPALEYLEIDSCSNLKFEPSLPMSARYIISGSKQYRRLFELPSFMQVMGLSTSAKSSKMEIKYSSDLSSRSLDSLRQLNIDELTVDSCNDSIPLPECIQSWKSLRKVEILNCENIETLPEWLGDMASLRELKVETYWMKILPPCIERLTSLQNLTLLKCTKRLKQRCIKEGDDWSKIKHIENIRVELRT